MNAKRFPVIVVAALIGGCGGEGSPIDLGGTNPIVSNLVVSPTSMLHNQGGGSDVKQTGC